MLVNANLLGHKMMGKCLTNQNTESKHT